MQDIHSSFEAYPLTQYSHGAGCGCKIAPAVLNQILQGMASGPTFPDLLVGNDQRDDAAVFDLGDGTAIVSTTDFFMPIVDDPFDFGRIAATNAISDIYAMGGTPLMAIAILGWPVNQLPTEVARAVIHGGKTVCEQAHIPLAGGHSIDCPEPIFGLAVTGRVKTHQLKQNGGAKAGDRLFLTKPLGVGILATAQKKGLIEAAHLQLAIETMTTLNRVGEVLATMGGVHAMTDVTGFGLLGHLSEMCMASQLSARIDAYQVPLLGETGMLQNYLNKGCIPGGTHRNWESYHEQVASLTERWRYLLADPQTSGGLLIAVAPDAEPAFLKKMQDFGLKLNAIGVMIERTEVPIFVETEA